MRFPALVLAGIAVFSAPASAQEAYRGWSIDASLVPEERRAESLASAKAQVDLVESLAIDPAIKDWLRTIPVALDPALTQGRAFRGRVTLKADPVPQENPVLLHECLHIFLAQRVPQGMRNPEIVGFFEAAKASGRFPPNAYMLTNSNEFFAMTASSVLWGRSERPPVRRDVVQRFMPDFYEWIVSAFGLKA
jgi:hypothetical protein